MHRYLRLACAAAVSLSLLAGCTTGGGSGHRFVFGPGLPPGWPHGRIFPDVLPSASPRCHPGLNASEFWLVSQHELRALITVAPQITRRAIKGDSLFVLGPPNRPSRLGRNVAVFQSYAKFRQALASHTIPAGTQWVLYDNERWPLTPVNEQLEPVHYETLFASLAHHHGYHVILAPGQDLVQVARGPARQPGASGWSRYLALGLPATSARLADIYEIQAQAAETPPDRPAHTYAREVASAVAQARRANPNATIFAGLSTNRVAAAAQMLTDFVTTRHLVDGYWLNVPHYFTPHQPLLASQFLGGLPPVAGTHGRTCARAAHPSAQHVSAVALARR